MSLDTEMADLLAKASILSEVAGLQLDAPRLHSVKVSAMAPHGDTRTLRDEMDERFRWCRCDADRAREVAWAKRELKGRLRPPQPPEGMAEKGSLAWKREIAKRGGQGPLKGDRVAYLSRFYGVSRATVFNYVKWYGERDAA